MERKNEDHRVSRPWDVDSSQDQGTPSPAAVRVLVVEDSRTNQLVARKVLEKMGFTADIASNGLEALNALGDKPYDIVLMDVHMPEMDGFEATRRIRNGSGPAKNPQIPIVAMTADNNESDREKCLSAGMNAYISKPIRPEALQTILDPFLSRKEPE